MHPAGENQNEWGDTGEIGPHGLTYWDFYIWDWERWASGNANDVAIYLWEGDECFGPFCNDDDPIVVFQVNRTTSYGVNRNYRDGDERPMGNILDDWDGEDIWLVLTTLKSPYETVWVEFGFQGHTETGEPDAPFSNLSRALNRVNEGGTILIRNGESPETPVISKRVRLEARGGSVRIGDE
jgi:hypothetical protein